MLKYLVPVREENGSEVSPKKEEEVRASSRPNSKTDRKDLSNDVRASVPHLHSPTKSNELGKEIASRSPKKLGGRERNGESNALKLAKELEKTNEGDKAEYHPSAQAIYTQTKLTVVPAAEELNGFCTEKSATTANVESSVRRRKGGQKTTRRGYNSPTVVHGTTKSKASKPPKQENKITTYFAIRKSERLTGSQIKERNLEVLKQAVLACSEESLKVMEFEGKGRGVVAAKDFTKGEFVVEYRGELISRFEALKREKSYQNDSSIGCYMYYFTFRNKHYCVDATEETEYKARLINHSAKEPNCVPKIVEVNNRPCIVLIASRDVYVGEELLYNYGDRSRASIAAHPWLVNS
ncbi:SET domain protein [Trichuris suis]|nr:SET domain protein [Trichuris suis]